MTTQPTHARETVLVDDQATLRSLLADWAPGVVGVDVERADSERYHRRAALVQVADPRRCLLIDAVVLDDFDAVDEFLGDRLAVLHAGQNDVVPLDAMGIRPNDVADTSLAAQLLGLPAGLGPLLDELLGVELSPDKERYQRADWEARPLTDGMLDYAAGDVFDLPPLWEELHARLVARGRWDWYVQELAAMLASARRDDRHWERVKGAGRLDPGQRAVLRALWEARERIARDHDIAPNRLLRDSALLGLALEPATSPRALAARQQRRRSPVHDHAEELFAAQQDGLAAAPEQRRGGRRPSVAARNAFAAMRRLRAERAEQLGIDAGVLLSSRALQPAVHGEPEDAASFFALADMRPWQVDLLGDDLWAAYTAEMASGTDD